MAFLFWRLVSTLRGVDARQRAPLPAVFLEHGGLAQVCQRRGNEAYAEVEQVIAAGRRQTTVFEEKRRQRCLLSGADTCKVLAKSKTKNATYDWSRVRGQLDRDIKSDRRRPELETRAGDLDALLVNLAIVRDVAAGKQLELPHGRRRSRRQLNYTVAGKEQITVDGKASRRPRSSQPHGTSRRSPGSSTACRCRRASAARQGPGHNRPARGALTSSLPRRRRSACAMHVNQGASLGAVQQRRFLFARDACAQRRLAGCGTRQPGRSPSSSSGRNVRPAVIARALLTLPKPPYSPCAATDRQLPDLLLVEERRRRRCVNVGLLRR